MTYPSYAAHWRAVHERQDWPQVERQLRHMYSQPVDWKRNPEGNAGSAFNQYLAFRIWSLGETPPLAVHCLELAKAQAAQAEALNGFADTGRPGAFPLNRHRFLADKIFIDAFASGSPLDPKLALEIAGYEQALAAGYTPREWDAYPQSEYLHTIELLLLTGEYARAGEMFAQARPLRALHVRELAEADKRICEARGPLKDKPEDRQGYRAMFDLLRSPGYADKKRGHPAFVWQKLVMALMWQKFFEPGDGTYDYDRALRLIAE